MKPAILSSLVVLMASAARAVIIEELPPDYHVPSGRKPGIHATPRPSFSRTDSTESHSSHAGWASPQPSFSRMDSTDSWHGHYYHASSPPPHWPPPPGHPPPSQYPPPPYYPYSPQHPSAPPYPTWQPSSTHPYLVQNQDGHTLHMGRFFKNSFGGSLSRTALQQDSAAKADYFHNYAATGPSLHEQSAASSIANRYDRSNLRFERARRRHEWDDPLNAGVGLLHDCVGACHRVAATLKTYDAFDPLMRARQNHPAPQAHQHPRYK